MKVPKTHVCGLKNLLHHLALQCFFTDDENSTAYRPRVLAMQWTLLRSLIL